MADETFTRMTRLIGASAMKRMHNARVIIFGVGGVGSWTAETLIRSGIGSLTIVDADYICESNINRQLMALHSTIGRPKVEVLRERLLDINPDAKIRVIQARFTLETSSGFSLEEYDYIIDAIDSLTDKANLILLASELARGGRRFYSSMGAALKLNPEKIAVADFANVKGCRLAAALRSKFKRMGRHPRRKFKCVYSEELIPNREETTDTSGVMDFGKVAFNGAAMHITSIFGITLASLVIRDLCSVSER